jgi:hypothetical protein
MSLKTPVLFLIFNRIETAVEVFESIRQERPERIFIAADGPRTTHPGEAYKCAEVRKRIIDMIDWQCEINTLFREKNLGCGLAVSQSITWFFEKVEYGIILEDDCLANSSFFYFCEELLERYKNDEMISHIGGNNFQKNRKGENSYYFSMYNHVWGWAAWRRSWDKFRFLMDGYSRENFISSLSHYKLTTSEISYWVNVFDHTYSNRHDIWDYQWTYAIWKNNSISIIPNVNLVKNIGFNQDATNTKTENNEIARLKLDFMKFPLKHPEKIEINREADKYTFKTFYLPTENTFKKIFRRLLKKIAP